MRGAGRIGPGLGRILAGADDRLLDGEAAYGAGGVAGFGRAGRGAWRGLVGGTVALGQGAARLSAGTGEWLGDLMPNGTAGLAGMAARDLRRMQTGMSHHYYLILALGLLAGAALLLSGG